VLDHDGKLIESGRITKVLAFRGSSARRRRGRSRRHRRHRRPAQGHRRHTICDPESRRRSGAADRSADAGDDVPRQRLAARRHRRRQGDGRMIRDRLFREAEGNVGTAHLEADDKDSMEVAGRGEVQLGILIETMRREGFELSVSRPKSAAADRRGHRRLMEPIEEVVIDLDEEHSGIVVQKMSERKAELIEMRRPAAAPATGVLRPRPVA
jgi:GTP-binding protein